MVIPLVDLQAQQQAIGDEIRRAITGVMARSDYILGHDLREFEQEFAAFCGSRHAVGCGSGSDAIYLACRALGIGHGDEVMMPAMTFAATALAVIRCGARPLLVDVDPDSALMALDQLRSTLTPRCKAIVPVHLYGQCVPMAEVLAFAREHGLAVIEDAAQAHGANRSGRRAGSFGDAGCFSFYPGKNLGALGDGGMVVSDRPEVTERIATMGNLGAARKHRHDRYGCNSRLDTLQAAVLRVKLRHLESWNDSRARLAQLYDELLIKVPGVQLTRTMAGSAHHLYVIRVSHRDDLVRALNEKGIGAGIHYPAALHELGFYRERYGGGKYPGAEQWARQCLSLPLYPELAEAEVRNIAAHVRHYLEDSRP